LQDAQRAVRLLRSRTVEWGIDPQEIGVIGFSAGGFTVFVYGVMSLNAGIPFSQLPLPVTAHEPDRLVTAAVPPVFMVAANDDAQVALRKA